MLKALVKRARQQAGLSGTGLRVRMVFHLVSDPRAPWPPNKAAGFRASHFVDPKGGGSVDYAPSHEHPPRHIMAWACNTRSPNKELCLLGFVKPTQAHGDAELVLMDHPPKTTAPAPAPSPDQNIPPPPPPAQVQLHKPEPKYCYSAYCSAAVVQPPIPGVMPNRDQLSTAFQRRLRSLLLPPESTEPVWVPANALDEFFDAVVLVMLLKVLRRQQMRNHEAAAVIQTRWEVCEQRLAARRLSVLSPEALARLLGWKPMEHAPLGNEGEPSQQGYCAPFEEVLECVAHRRCVLVKGWAFFPREQLRETAVLGCIASKRVSFDTRLQSLFQIDSLGWHPDFDGTLGVHMYKQLVQGLQYLADGGPGRPRAQGPNPSPHQLIRVKVEKDPPCWKQLQSRHSVQDHLKFEQRKVVGQVYRALGVPVEAFGPLWVASFARPSDYKSATGYWKSQQRRPASSERDRQGPDCVRMARLGLCPVASRTSGQGFTKACCSHTGVGPRTKMTPAEVVRAVRSAQH